MLRVILKLGGILKWLSLALGVLVIGCFVCEIPEEPEGILEFEGSCEVQVKGEVTYEFEGETQTRDNEVCGDLMLGLADGLTDGDCWGGNTEGYLIGEWANFGGQGFPNKKLYWSESFSEITYTGGTGSCDSVIYVSTTKQWPYGGTVWKLHEAWIYRPEAGLPSLSNNIVKQAPHGTLNDTVNAGDYVQISWEITVHPSDASGEGNFATDTLAYDLCEGIRYDDMPYVLYIQFIYNNADSVLRTVSAETWYSSDTSQTRAIFTAQDTIRNAANDTLYEMRLINTHDEAVAMDTTNRYMSTNKAAKMVWTVYLFEWPQ